MVKGMLTERVFMNILSFLTPKSEVSCVKLCFSLRQTMEKMENCSYTAVPVLDDEEKYVGTLTEGDLLWYLKERSFPSIYEAQKLSLSDVERKTVVSAVGVNTKMDELLNASLGQNFVPVIDDRGVFIGIVTRKKLIQYFIDKQNGYLSKKQDII